MTCKERLILDHPNWSMKDVEDIISIECPELFGYLPDPDFCIGESQDCVKCWNRDLSERKEPEHFDIRKLEFVEPTESHTDDTSEIDDLRSEIDIYKKIIEEQRVELIRCNAIIRTVEQLTSTRLPKVKTNF